jgi:hypothetical protein
MLGETALQTSPEGAMPARKRPAWMVWATAFCFLLVLLIGRYSWERDRRAVSMEGYLASAWMLLLLLPTVFYTMRLLVGRRAAMATTAILALICVFPYQWLGFSGTRFWSDTVVYSDWSKHPNSPLPVITWFPAALWQGPTIPHEALAFGLLLAAGAAALLWASRGRLTWGWFARHPAWIVMVIAFLLILLESWLHLSLRAPYSYTMHYAEQVQRSIDPLSKRHRWWHIYLFPDYRGAVNADYGWSRAGEDVFHGVPPIRPSPIMRRLLTPYLASQFTYFFNPYYVYLFLNTAWWLAAAAAGFALARRLTDIQTAVVFSLLIATGCGFIYFINQPMSYLSGYAAEIVLIYLFDILLDDQPGWENVWLFGLVYGLGMLVSDLLPLAPLFIFYGLVRRVHLRRSITAIAIACCIYFSTLAFLIYVARVPNVLGNFDLLLHSTTDLAHMTANRFYVLCLQFLSRFTMDLIHGFLILPLLPALAALAFVRQRKLALVIAAMMLPALCTIADLEFSGALFQDWPLAALPRLAYIAYPAVYLLAAIGLVEGSVRIFRSHPRLARGIPWLFLLVIFVLNNLDVFGVPATYYHFYFGTNESGLPHFSEPHD